MNQAPDFTKAGVNLGRAFESEAELLEVAGEPITVTDLGNGALMITGASQAAQDRIEYHRPASVRVTYVER